MVYFNLNKFIMNSENEKLNMNGHMVKNKNIINMINMINMINIIKILNIEFRGKENKYN